MKRTARKTERTILLAAAAAAVAPHASYGDLLSNPPVEDPVTFNSLTVALGDGSLAVMDEVTIIPVDLNEPDETVIVHRPLRCRASSDGKIRLDISYDVSNPSAVYWRIMNRKGATQTWGQGSTTYLFKRDFEPEGTFRVELVQANPLTVLAAVKVQSSEPGCPNCEDCGPATEILGGDEGSIDIDIPAGPGRRRAAASPTRAPSTLRSPTATTRPSPPPSRSASTGASTATR